MKKYIKWIPHSLIILCVITIWASSIYYNQVLKEQYSTISIRFHEDGVNVTNIERVKENEIAKENEVPKITAWNRTKESEVISESIGNKKKVSIYEVFGDCNDVCPMELIDGTYVDGSDFYGCIVDENTAYELFGTKRVVGNPIVVQDKTYYVRGVAKINQSILLFQIRDQRHKFSNLEVVYSNVERGGELVKMFMLQNGFPEDYTIIEGEFYVKLVSKICLIPAWILMFILIIKSIVVVNKSIKLKWKVLIDILVIVIFIVGLMWLTGIEFYYPLRMIPSKWSDLDFWVSKYKDFQKLVQEITYLTPQIRDVMMFKYLKISIICSAIFSVNLLILMRQMSKWIYYNGEKLISIKFWEVYINGK